MGTINAVRSGKDVLPTPLRVVCFLACVIFSASFSMSAANSIELDRTSPGSSASTPLSSTFVSRESSLSDPRALIECPGYPSIPCISASECPNVGQCATPECYTDADHPIGCCDFYNGGTGCVSSDPCFTCFCSGVSEIYRPLCDDHDDSTDDFCDSGTCTHSHPSDCGNGVVEPHLGETCDPPDYPAGVHGYRCRANCSVCGDGIFDGDRVGGEDCDDGNTVDDDDCPNNCHTRIELRDPVCETAAQCTGSYLKVREDGLVVIDPLKLFDIRERRTGAVTDGVTQLLIRRPHIHLGQDPVTLYVVGPDGPALDDRYGVLMDIARTRQGRQITINPDPDHDGYIFALYRVPIDFPAEPGDPNSRHNGVEIMIREGGDSTGQAVLKLFPPPLVLVHGLWSDPGTWNLFASDPRFSGADIPFTSNYSKTNASGFRVNEFLVADSFRQAVTRLRLRNIAATQVDVLGHSMGGVLTRVHSDSSEYLGKRNYLAGDVHKLVTLDSPHAGSPLANLLVRIRENQFLGPIAINLMNSFDKPIDRGALDDLAIGSTELRALQSMRAPSHAMVGIGGSDALEMTPGWLGSLYALVFYFCGTTGLFEEFQHDAIVGRISQTGGLPDSQTSVFGGLDGIHIRNCESPLYMNRGAELLNSSTTAPVFGRFTAGAAFHTLLSCPSAVYRATTVSQGLTITAPPAGTIVRPGDTVHVVVDTIPGDLVSTVLLVGPETTAVDTQPPFEFDLLVPSNAIGSFTIDAAGKDANGDWYTTTNPVTLRATPTAALVALHIIPQEPIIFGVGQVRPLMVTGDYADAISRNISKPQTGTIYLTSTPSIVSVDEQGLVTSLSPGIGTVIVQNSGVQDSSSVTVIAVPESGACGSDSDCDDSNPCTNDACNQDDVCVYTNNTATCDDHNACTGEDVCRGGVCLPGPPTDADDGNICTDDSCDPLTGVVFTPNSNPCDDGNACTRSDTCDALGACVGTIMNPKAECNDNNACTLDICDPDVGCMHGRILCNDHDRNTIDYCDPRRGCVFTPRHVASPIPPGAPIGLDQE